MSIKKFLFLLTFLFSINVNANGNDITINDIKLSLADTPSINVGFDIDDTVLFSSPGFYYHTKRLCGGNIIECINRNDFWESVNSSDQYSLPKKIGFQLIKMHQERGDKIYFITARKNPSKNEKVTSLLKETFNIRKMNKVIFTGISEGKVKSIKDNDIKIYYGDSDGDIQDANEAGARPIRVMRARNSINHLPFTLGAFNEEVLLNSDV
ncbi:MAG: acid phosphatase AphA [Rickettsiaceae bacterium H1]|nr:acid phosphatase AphA [Rickettsiaceae bacterium H1]